MDLHHHALLCVVRWAVCCGALDSVLWCAGHAAGLAFNLCHCKVTVADLLAAAKCELQHSDYAVFGGLILLLLMQRAVLWPLCCVVRLSLQQVT
jgi:hypothetical protein